MEARGPESGRLVTRRGINADLFWSKVAKGPGCWEWSGHKGSGGYGTTSVRGMRGPVFAHRAAYALRHGRCPKGKVIMHTCDNKVCVNPKHLRAASQGENYRDAMRKGLIKCTKASKCRWCERPPVRGAKCEWHYAESLAHRMDRKRTAIRAKNYQGVELSFPELVARFGERRAEMFADNHGLYGRHPRTLTMIGKREGVSRERVRQLVARVALELGLARATFFGSAEPKRRMVPPRTPRTKKPGPVMRPWTDELLGDAQTRKKGRFAELYRLARIGLAAETHNTPLPEAP